MSDTPKTEEEDDMRDYIADVRRMTEKLLRLVGTPPPPDKPNAQITIFEAGVEK